MFCPNCDEYLSERDLIKSHVKKWEDTDIEYDARCPACNMKIGRMSWGKLEVVPELRERYEERLAREAATALAEKPGEVAPFFDPPLPPAMEEEEHPGDFDDWKKDAPYTSYTPPGTYRADQMSGHYCPHCGGDLPNDINLLPRRPGNR